MPRASGRKSGVVAVRCQGFSPENCKSRTLKRSTNKMIKWLVADRCCTPEKGEQKRNHPIILLASLFSQPAKAHLHFLPFACHPLLTTSVPLSCADAIPTLKQSNHSPFIAHLAYSLRRSQSSTLTGVLFLAGFGSVRMAVRHRITPKPPIKGD